MGRDTRQAAAMLFNARARRIRIEAGQTIRNHASREAEFSTVGNGSGTFRPETGQFRMTLRLPPAEHIQTEPDGPSPIVWWIVVSCLTTLFWGAVGMAVWLGAA